ncbi:hypothetical protein EFB08_04950 [Rufibacter latericius]|uniref:Uncharacterized protein n=1 Tax=Rufibacter latericius TaxID=2487040 RepID=A0A3M9MYP0_9BACT|nr:hypothetical protein EFB08_04950 [Rufibacter latericius]
MKATFLRLSVANIAPVQVEHPNEYKTYFHNGVGDRGASGKSVLVESNPMGVVYGSLLIQVIVTYFLNFMIQRD